MKIFAWTVCFAVAFFAASLTSAAQTEDRIEAAVASATKYLGDHDVFGTGTPGEQALAALALLLCKTPPDDPVLTKGLAVVPARVFLEESDYQFVYAGALYLMACGLANDKAFRRFMPQTLKRLLALQGPDGGWGDVSRTQFAVMGLKAAFDMNVFADARVVSRARKHLLAIARDDGTYTYQHPSTARSRHAMTAAAVSSLYLLDQMATSFSEPGSYPDNPLLDKALKSLEGGDLFEEFYSAYGIERIGLYSGERTVAGRDWFPDLVNRVMLSREADGSFGDGQWFTHRLTGTAFGLMLLGRARVPLLIQKMRFDGAGRYDAANLAAWLSETHGLAGDWQWIGPGETEEVGKAPVLMLTGRGTFTLEEKMRQRIRTFVLDENGFVLAGAAGGDAGFDASLRSEISKIFDGEELTAIPRNYPALLFSGSVDEKTRILHLKTGCRSRLIYFPDGITYQLERKVMTRGNDPDGMSRVNAATSFVLFAASFRLPVKKGEEWRKPHTPAPGATGRPIVAVARTADGKSAGTPELVWLTAHMNGQLGTNIRALDGVVGIGDAAARTFPIVYLKAVGQITLDRGERTALREYLLRGGFLIAEACGGYPETRRALFETIGAIDGLRISDDPAKVEKIMNAAYKIRHPELQPAAERAGLSAGAVRVILDADDRVVGAVFGLDVSSGLPDGADGATLGFARSDCYRLLANAVYYVLTER